MRNLAILSVVIVSLAGCYEFQSPPFAEKDLTPIDDTAFGKDVKKALEKVNDTDKNSPITKMKKALK